MFASVLLSATRQPFSLTPRLLMNSMPAAFYGLGRNRALNQAVTAGDKPIFRPLAAEGAATASLLEEQISALKEISSLLRDHLEETRKDRDAWRTEAESRRRLFGRRVKGFLGAMTGVLVTILTVFLWTR